MTLEEFVERNAIAIDIAQYYRAGRGRNDNVDPWWVIEMMTRALAGEYYSEEILSSSDDRITVPCIV